MCGGCSQAVREVAAVALEESVAGEEGEEGDADGEAEGDGVGGALVEHGFARAIHAAGHGVEDVEGVERAGQVFVDHGEGVEDGGEPEEEGEGGLDDVEDVAKIDVERAADEGEAGHVGDLHEEDRDEPEVVEGDGDAEDDDEERDEDPLNEDLNELREDDGEGEEDAGEDDFFHERRVFDDAVGREGEREREGVERDEAEENEDGEMLHVLIREDIGEDEDEHAEHDERVEERPEKPERHVAIADAKILQDEVLKGEAKIVDVAPGIHR